MVRDLWEKYTVYSNYCNYTLPCYVMPDHCAVLKALARIACGRVQLHYGCTSSYSDSHCVTIQVMSQQIPADKTDYGRARNRSIFANISHWLELSLLCKVAKQVPALGLSNTKWQMATMHLQDSSLQLDSWPTAVGLVWQLAATWYMLTHIK